MSEDKTRDRWDKLQILLDPLGKILTAIMVVLLGYYGNKALQDDQKRRAYVELLSRREEADSNLRKDMFGKVIDQFVGQNNTKLDTRILNLELLVSNFHESIDLAPLLRQVYLASWEDKEVTTKHRKRLQSLTQDVVGREVATLTETGFMISGEVHFDELQRGAPLLDVIKSNCLKGRELPAKQFAANVMNNPAVDLQKQPEVDVELVVKPCEGAQNPGRRFEFTVSPFDFPMIDNVRLEGRSRVSVVMTRVDDAGVTLSLVYFPGSRTSLKDKPFHEEVLKALEGVSASN